MERYFLELQGIGVLQSKEGSARTFAQGLVPAQSLAQKRDESLFEGGTTGVDLLVREGGSCGRDVYCDSKLRACA